MKSYKTISRDETDQIMKAYPELALPFVDPEDIPNNWLKMHGYSMHRRCESKKAAWMKKIVKYVRKKAR